jgi:hypothetical protein
MSDLANIDDPAVALLLHIQLEDIELLLASIREEGGSSDGVVSDAELSLQLEKEELERNAAIVADRQITRSTARAVIGDAQVIAALREEDEADEVDDGSIASDNESHDEHEEPSTPSSTGSTGAARAIDDEFIDKLSALYVETPVECPEESTTLANTESRIAPVSTADVTTIISHNSGLQFPGGESSPGAASQQPNKIDKRECVICGEKIVFFEVARLSCNHECCRECLEIMFKAAIVDESRYPPKCCDQVSVDSREVRVYLSSDIRNEYEVKKIEWDTANRTYCSKNGCGLFIRTEHVVAGLATCQTCNAATCAMCKKAAHDGDCPNDEALQETLAVLDNNGWVRCPQCHAGVELSSGCYHIT